MTNYRNGKKKLQPGPYNTMKKSTKDEEDSNEEVADQVLENECQNCKENSETLVV